MTFQEEIDKAIKDRWIYFVGDRLPSDWYAAFKEWQQLAEAGDVKAQVNLGWCYFKGLGTELDFEQAGTWLAKAAAQHEPRAYTALFWLCYAEGFKGKDPKLGEEYLAKAVALQEPKALGYMQERAAAKAKKEYDDAARIRRIQEAALVTAAEEAGALKKAKETAFATSVQGALDLKDLKKAKQLLLGADADNYWAPRLLPYLELKSVYEKDSELDKKYLKGGVVNGTTQNYTQNKWRYRAIVHFTNPTAEELRVKFDGKEHTVPPSSTKGCSTHYNDSDTQHVVATFCPVLTSAPLEFEIPLPRPVEIPPTKSGSLSNMAGRCFVLTACYGDEDHPVVKDFRSFRDEHLIKKPVGRVLVAVYYRVGPILAEAVSGHPLLMAVLRKVFGRMRRLLPKKRGD